MQFFGPGSFLATDEQAAPAAGADIEYTVPDGARLVLLGLSVDLTTDANVANRTFVIVIDDGAAEFSLGVAANVHTAATTLRYVVCCGLSPSRNASGLVQVCLPSPIYLRDGFRIRTVVENLQAGDQLGAMNIMCQSWPNTEVP